MLNNSELEFSNFLVMLNRVLNLFKGHFSISSLYFPTFTESGVKKYLIGVKIYHGTIANR
jgi:hypothetical protein